MDQKFRRAGWPFSRYSLQAPDWGELQSKFRRGILCRNRRPAFKKDRSRTGSVDDTRLLWLAAESRSQPNRRPFPPTERESRRQCKWHQIVPHHASWLSLQPAGILRQRLRHFAPVVSAQRRRGRGQRRGRTEGGRGGEEGV